MKIPRALRLLILLCLIFINIGCDQISKKMVRSQVAYHQEIYLIPDHLLLTKVENRGAFLSLGSSLSPKMKQWILLGLPAVGLSFMLVMLIGDRKLDRHLSFSLACIIGGGVGNLIDRFLYGSVTDFLFMDFGIFHTGIFNLADVSISVGIVYYIFIAFLKRFNDKTEPAT